MADALAGLVRYNADNPQAKDATKIINKYRKKAIYFAEFNFEKIK